jgi:hypothetical protein
MDLRSFAGPSLGTGLADAGRWPGSLGSVDDGRPPGDGAIGGATAGLVCGCSHCCDAAGDAPPASAAATNSGIRRGIGLLRAIVTIAG